MTIRQRAGTAMAAWPMAGQVPPVIRIHPVEEIDWSGELDEADMDLTEIFEAVEEGKLP